MNIIVLGGSGFIGTRLVRDLLKMKHKVAIFDKVESQSYDEITIIGDVRDSESLNNACKNFDIIFNLAAEHADNVTPKSLYSEVNIGGAKNLVHAAKINGIKHIIFTSSVAIYGLNRPYPDENMKANPFNEYGRTKMEAEFILINWAKEDMNNSLTIIRPSVIFGERNRGNVFNLMEQLAKRRFLMIGKGSNLKSMGYVGNISAFLAEQTISKPGITIYNYADKPDLTSKEIVDIVNNELGIKKENFVIPYYLAIFIGIFADLLAKLTNRKLPISKIRVKKFCAETTINTDRLLESGFKAPFKLEEGLRKMVKNEFKSNSLN